jgi:hypothetical protein
MKRMIVLHSLVCLCLVVFASFGYAGDYHSGLTLKCQECHVMHYSQDHGYSADGNGATTPLAGGPHEYLLRDDVNDLCLACHDGQGWAPDVFEGHSNGFVRQGGALNEVGGNGQYPPATGHTLGSTDVAPGGTWAADSTHGGMTCANCHAVHGGNRFGSSSGTSSYRNLGGNGTQAGSSFAITYTHGGSNPLTAWVHEDGNAGNSASHYGAGAITFNEPDGTASQYAAFCKSCHTDFHGVVGEIEIGGAGNPAIDFHRHPAAGVDVGAAGGGHSRMAQVTAHANQVQMLSPTGKKAGAYVASDLLTPSCMSCHKGHGNQNAFGLIYMAGSGPVTEEGDSTGTALRDLCRQCHGQGTPWP